MNIQQYKSFVERFSTIIAKHEKELLSIYQTESSDLIVIQYELFKELKDDFTELYQQTDFDCSALREKLRHPLFFIFTNLGKELFGFLFEYGSPFWQSNVFLASNLTITSAHLNNAVTHYLEDISLIMKEKEYRRKVNHA